MHRAHVCINKRTKQHITKMIDKTQIDALIDGELNKTDEERILKKIEQTPDLNAYYTEIKLQKQTLKEWWALHKKLN